MINNGGDIEMNIEHLEVFGFAGAVRGMRNAMNSWHLADSTIVEGNIIIGPNDLKLLLNLCKAGTSHRKVLRMMHIQMDITAPLYWWKDYDTYKVSTVANSCSTMHKIHAKFFNISDFATDHLDRFGLNLLTVTIDTLNHYRNIFIDSDLKDKHAWNSMIQLLPSSYNQKRTLDINYETALAILLDRRNHKLKEFRDLCETLLVLPYMDDIYTAVNSKEK